VEPDVGVEDFDADDAVVFPVEDDPAVDAAGQLGWEGGAAGLEVDLGEADVDGVGVLVVGDAHGSILLARSATSWR
jgi:hypothetical protein